MKKVLDSGYPILNLLLNIFKHIKYHTHPKTYAKIEVVVTQDGNEIKKEAITINESNEEDFPIIVTGLTKGNYDFKFNIVEGSFDLEYILYENWLIKSIYTYW